METGPERSHFVDATPRSGGHLLISLIFLLTCVLPILVASFFQASSGTGPGRVGLIMPALLLAEDSSRLLLWRGLVGCGLSLLVALGGGVTFGLLCSRVHSKVSNSILRIILWPGQCPAWVFPLGWVALMRPAAGDVYFGEVPVLAWVVWVGWWGGLRVAGAIRQRALQIMQSQWDAVVLAGAGPWRSARVVLKPLVLADVRQELRTVAGVTLFDPTPVLFWGISAWPMGALVNSLRAGGLLGASLAATWGFCMLMVVLAWFGVIQLLTRSRHRVETFSIAMEHQVKKDVTSKGPTVGIGLWLMWLGLWPWVGMGMGVKSFFDKPLMEVPSPLEAGLAVSDGLFITTWLGGICAGVLVALVASLAVGRISRSNLNQLHRLSATWPVGLAALGLAIMVRYQALPVMNPAVGLQVSPVMAGLVWYLVMAVLAIGRAGGIGGRVAAGAMQVKTNAAFEAALVAGASPARAMRLAGRSSMQQIDIKQVMNLFIGWWWVWSAPAWGMAGLGATFYGPTWGSFLVNEWGNQPEHILLFWVATFLPVLLAKLVQALVRR